MVPNEQSCLILYCDGASRGNPGAGSYGFAIYQQGELVHEGYGRLGTVTNNVAEYNGVLEGLQQCKKLGASEVLVRSDSELLVRQLNGQYKVRSPQLIPLFEKVRKMVRHFSSVSFHHVPREENSLADALANRALDRLD